jgi:hypothetical protein
MRTYMAGHRPLHETTGVSIGNQNDIHFALTEHCCHQVTLQMLEFQFVNGMNTSEKQPYFQSSLP